MTDIQQAREWAEDVRRIEAEYGSARPDVLAAAEIIQSLPDQWIDAEKLREVLDRWAENPFPTSDEVAVLNDFEALLTPSLPTLADMTPEGRDTQKWMQAKVFPTASTLGIITGVDEYAHSAIILFADGRAKNVPWRHITPLPDAPKLVWPSLSVSDESEPVSVETEDVTEESRTTLPRPEDVPAGEPWIVQHEDREWIGCRNGTRFPWLVIGRDYHDFDYCHDVDITLVSRLVPEVTP